MNIDLARLAEHFDPRDIEWRIGRSGIKGDKPWAVALAYIDNRAIMNRLDESCGPENWRNEYKPWPVGDKAGVLCGISIKVDGEWITKWDGAENTDIESVKGGLSDSMKRAGVQWGIGRYLYNLTETFVECTTDRPTKDKDLWHYAKGKSKESSFDFYWMTPLLPKWALPAVSPSPAKAAPTARDESVTISAMNAYGARVNKVNVCGDVDAIMDEAEKDDRLKDTPQLAQLRKLATGRKAVLEPMPEPKKKRTPIQIVADFKSKVATCGMDQVELKKLRSFLDEGGAEKAGLSADQILECDGVLRPAEEKAEAYQEEPAGVV